MEAERYIFFASLATDVPRARARLELDKFAGLDAHCCGAWGVHAVRRVRRARGCAREMQVPTGGCPCSGGQKADCQLDGYNNVVDAPTTALELLNLYILHSYQTAAA